MLRSFTLISILPFLILLNGCTSHSSESEVSDHTDTVKQVKKNKDELARLIPAELFGYKPLKAPEGLDIKAKNAEFSFTMQYYYKDGDSINIELHDYLDAQMLYETYASQWWLSGTQTDSPVLKSGLVNLGNGIDAWMVNYKDEKRTTIFAGVRNRYYLIFECFGRISTDFIESVARQFNYKPLLQGV